MEFEGRIRETNPPKKKVSFQRKLRHSGKKYGV